MDLLREGGREGWKKRIWYRLALINIRRRERWVQEGARKERERERERHRAAR